MVRALRRIHAVQVIFKELLIEDIIMSDGAGLLGRDRNLLTGAFSFEQVDVGHDGMLAAFNHRTGVQGLKTVESSTCERLPGDHNRINAAITDNVRQKAGDLLESLRAATVTCRVTFG